MEPEPESYDLVVRRVHLIDPAQGIDGERDVAFRAGVVAALAESLGAVEARRQLDAAGLLAYPGWIDLHVHVYPGVSHYGVWPDSTCLTRGATTVVDAGTAGAATFNGLKWFVADRSRTRVLALLHISRIGLCLGLELDPPLGELFDPRLISVPEAVRCIEQNRDVIVGVKVRLSGLLSEGGRYELEALQQARRVAEATGLPFMVHFPNSSLPLATILEQMRPGDILTHCFHGHRCAIVDGAGRVRPELLEAVERGVRLDVGHGVGSFSYAVARAAIEQGVKPYAISSDLHSYNVNGPVWDLAATLSKFMHLAMTLQEVIECATSRPAELIGRAGQLGTLSPGAPGDMVLFRIESGQRPLPDTLGRVETLGEWIEVCGVVKGGQLVREP